jgi:hypothetical protein
LVWNLRAAMQHHNVSTYHDGVILASRIPSVCTLREMLCSMTPCYCVRL